MNGSIHCVVMMLAIERSGPDRGSRGRW